MRALCGHCAGTVQEAWPCRIGYMIRYSLDHFLGLPERIATYSPSWAVGLPMQQSSSPLGPMSCSAQVLFFTPRDGMWRHLEVKKAVHTREEKAGIRCVDIGVGGGPMRREKRNSRFYLPSMDTIFENYVALVGPGAVEV